jgi:PAS domain S-box-containing protein
MISQAEVTQTAARELEPRLDEASLERLAPKHILAVLPIAVSLLVTMAVLRFDLLIPNNGRGVLPLNILFVTLVGVLVSYLGALSVRRSGSAMVLMFSCATLMWGLAGLDTSIARAMNDNNRALTVGNTTSLITGLMHLLVMISAYYPQTRLTHAKLKMNVALVLTLGATGALVGIGHSELLPPFCDENFVPTTLRKVVLGIGIVLHYVAGLGLCWQAARRQWVFGWWYGLALLMLAAGLTGILLINRVGGSLGLTGRLAQYIGGIYLFTAAMTAVRQSGDWDAKLQSALTESRQRFRTLAQATFEGILVSQNGVIVDANQQIHDMLGCRMPELLGRHLVDLVPAEEQARMLSDLSDGCTLICEYCLIRNDGSKIMVEARSRTLHSENQPRIITAIRDITDRKRQEVALAEANRKLGDSLLALRQSHDELEQRVAQRTTELEVRANQLSKLTSELTLAEQRERRRLATLLHDHLQQLLVGARLGLEVVARRTPADHRSSMTHVESLINEAIEASRTLTVELSPPILHEAGLAAGLQWLARWMRDKHGLDVAMRFDSRVVCEREDVSVLVFGSVRELLFNVVKHAGVNRAEVELSLHGSRHFRVTVCDQGAGFNPTRVAPGSEGSTGFGLFSIRERLAMLGGRLEIDSDPQRGTCISLIAPLRDAVASPDALQSSLPASDISVDTCPTYSPTPAAARGKIRLLLTDDHEVLRQGLASLLAEEPMIEVVGQASNGVEAIEQARKLNPDIVLMDFSMPRMDGVEATRRLHLELPHIQVIGLSMYEESDRAAAMMEAGAQAYLTKSGKSEILIDTIKNIWRLKRGPQPAAKAPAPGNAAVLSMRQS